VENIHLNDKPEWFTQKNPLGTVPFLCHANVQVMDSANVLRYIDEAFDGPSLSPSDPVIQAEQGGLVSVFQSKFVGAYGKVLKGKPEDVIVGKEAYPKALEWLEGVMSKKKSTFINGDGPGLADIMIFPWIPFTKCIQELGMVQLNWEKCPSLVIRKL